MDNHQLQKPLLPFLSMPQNSSIETVPTPTPVTPVSKPTFNDGGIDPPSFPPGSPDPVHDLPPTLLANGWRRFWSKREGRPYFFNKVTNQSLWEMPSLESGEVKWPLYSLSKPCFSKEHSLL